MLHTSENKKILLLEGKIREKENGDHADALYIGADIIAEAISDNFQSHRAPVFCCWAISERPITPYDLLGIAVEQANGDVDAIYYHRYSEITGYLWTEQDAIIGGHNLVEIFGNHIKRYAILVVSDGPIDLMEVAEIDE